MTGRTPEERERARLEREARRAARARGEKPPKEGGLLGGLLGGKGDSDGAGARAERPAPAEPPARAERPAPAKPPARAKRPQPAKPATRATRPAPPEPPTRSEPQPLAPPPARRAVHKPDLERIRRLTQQRRAGRPGAADAGAAGAPPGAAAPGEPSRRRRAGRIVMAVAVIGLALVAWVFASIYQPFKGEAGADVRVTIPTGAGVGDIADLLEQQGVVSSATFFEVRATLDGARGDLKPGTYTLNEDMSHGAAIDALSAGPPNDIIRLVIPEGRSRSEVAQLVADAGLEGDYVQATRRSRILDPRDYGAERVRNLEGFLWPATYELEPGSSVQTLVNKQLRAFIENFDGVSLREARRKNLTAYDVLIIASMVEREAMLDEERPLIASVIYNRLRRGEPLGIDATIRFATENWSEPLTQSDLELDSPYNTRTNAGLPPTPIGSPGLESIEAAANPANTDFLFYVVKPGTCGEHEFSETLAEFEQDAARYNREREARGGQSPTDC